MRKIVIAMAAVLTLTGLALVFGAMLAVEIPQRKLISLGHIWGGVFFIVIFPLYAWDHIGANRFWLRKPALVTLSGFGQGLSALLLIVSGVLLFLYGSEAWAVARSIHHWSTYPLVAALALHFLSPKSSPPKKQLPTNQQPKTQAPDSPGN